MDDDVGRRFVEDAIGHGVPEETADAVFVLVAGFGDFGEGHGAVEGDNFGNLEVIDGLET